jgi:prolyl-tRNA synthetase
MYKTYCKIFDRIGVKYRVVEADTGAIGGSASHEFQLLADIGEDLIFYSDTGTYAANIEQATSKLPEIKDSKPNQDIELIDTPNVKTIEDVSKLLSTDSKKSVKTLIVKGREQPMVALVLRGDDELNPIKAQKHPLVFSPLTFLDEEQVKKALKVNFGSIGPVKLNLPIIADYNARALDSFICGANINDKHYLNASWNRDAKCDDVYDLRNVKVGDVSPDGQGVLQECRGIEVGHIFQLGDKYAKAMKAEILNEEGRRQAMLMGCYGLGVSRIVAAIIEQFHDDKGIIWPTSVAPFQLSIIPINYQKSTEVKTLADKLYKECKQLGIEVLLDDRKERPGVLFADNDLLGIPHRIVIGDKLLEKGQVEYKHRSQEESSYINLNEMFSFIENNIKIS